MFTSVFIFLFGFRFSVWLRVVLFFLGETRKGAGVSEEFWGLYSNVLFPLVVHSVFFSVQGFLSFRVSALSPLLSHFLFFVLVGLGF